MTFRHGTYRNESLVLDAVVTLGICQALQDVKAVLEGLHGALQVAQLLLQAAHRLGLLVGHTLKSHLLLLVQSLPDDRVLLPHSSACLLQDHLERSRKSVQ